MIPDLKGSLVLTGAGVSTDSGIPDYRGPDSPPRTPMTYQEFIATPEAQQRYWARAFIGWRFFGRAEPNDTHRLLAESQHDLTGLITQNVDGLHSTAGHRQVIDLHGRADRVICLECRHITTRASMQRRLTELNPEFDRSGFDRAGQVAPDGDVVLDRTDDFVLAACHRCGGRLKPDVVFFGESVEKSMVDHCFELVDQASGLLVLGSSLQVMSGLRFVRAASKRGIPITIVNRGTTRGDDLATTKIDAGCAETLTAWGLTRAPSATH